GTVERGSRRALAGRCRRAHCKSGSGKRAGPTVQQSGCQNPSDLTSYDLLLEAVERGGGRVVAQRFAWRRLIPVLVIVAGLVTFFALGLERYLSIESLHQHREALRAWVETSGVLAALIFMVVYIVTVAFALPTATVLSITSGFLFGAI